MLLRPDLKNSGILESISKIKNQKKVLAICQNENSQDRLLRNIESKIALRNEVIFQSATKPVFVRSFIPQKAKMTILGQKN